MSGVRTVDGLPDDGPVARALYLADSREINLGSEELTRRMVSLQSRNVPVMY